MIYAILMNPLPNPLTYDPNEWQPTSIDGGAPRLYNNILAAEADCIWLNRHFGRSSLYASMRPDEKRDGVYAWQYKVVPVIPMQLSDFDERECNS